MQAQESLLSAVAGGGLVEPLSAKTGEQAGFVQVHELLKGGAFAAAGREQQGFGSWGRFAHGAMGSGGEVCVKAGVDGPGT
ncbi:MAG: hypothetical protein DHS20C15_25100 [Planctomycetota bacterium]|nr:MAG: hypothetical protein DHS20C15_25100 [Planctomycetota bacterium]